MTEAKSVCVLLVENEPETLQRVQICLRQFKELPFEVIRSGKANNAIIKTVDTRARDMRFEVTSVNSVAEALDKISEFHFDIILLSANLPDSPGLPAIRTVKQATDSVPIIVLIDDDNDVRFSQASLNAGAKGYVVKDNSGYEGLVRFIRYVLHRTDVETRNQLLVAALEATSNAVIITDREGRIEWVNPAFTQLSGYSFQEALGRKPNDLLKSGFHDENFYQDMWQMLLNGQHWQGEIINRHKEGNFYNADVGISPVRNKDGSLSGYVQIHRDITDSMVLLSISEVLQQASPLESRFKQVLDILFNLKSFDSQRKGAVFLDAQNGTDLMVSVQSGSLNDKFIKKESLIHHSASLSGRVFRSGEVLVSDDCFCIADQAHLLLDMHAHGHYLVPLISCGKTLGVMFLFADSYPIQTESRLGMLKEVGEMMALAVQQEEARNALEKARDLAMQASLIKSEFLANMSHEIRTPMNGVIGMLDLLRDTRMSQTQQDWVDTAYNSAEALLEIINDILDFSKLEAGKFALEHVDFSLVDLVDDICALLAVRAYAKGLELNCSLPVPMPIKWRGDSMRVRQVLTNLIGNAVKFTERGEIYIKVTRTSLTAGQDEVRFEVHDSGIGISEEAQRQLFEPFSQAESATSRRFGGSGLGLSISKSLVELMGGQIGMRSTLGVGTCFWFTLPLEYVEESESMVLSCDLSGKKTLIVDDNATNRNILVNYLTSWGLQVSEVDNGSAALMQLQASASNGGSFDLILLDVHMPIMDGLTLAKFLAQIPTLSKIPIILISSGDQFHQDDYQNTAIVQRILKPIRQMQLFDVIVSTLHCKEAATKPIVVEPELPSYTGKTVLVVEDNKINQKVIVAKLAKFGITPDVVENGQIALDKLVHKRYDLILMDCHMPVMDGYTATQELRLFESRENLPSQIVVALTANALEGEREKCLAAGMDDYLTKPILSEALQTCLSYYFNQSEEGGTIDEDKSNQAPVCELDQILEQLDNDYDLLHEMIDLFLMECPKQLDDLKKAQGNPYQLAEAAHAIKGTLGHFNADYAKGIADKIEKQAQSGQSAELQNLTESLVVAVSEVTLQLQQMKRIRSSH